jgi:predicted transcriptional regulator
MKELTKAEEQVMHYIWQLEKAFLKDIVEQFPEPRPAYTTISTVIRVLVKKGVVGHRTYGKIHEYYPLISKQSYFRGHIKRVVGNFFNGSVTSFTSCFTDDGQLTLSQLEEIKQQVEKQIDLLKKNKDA